MRAPGSAFVLLLCVVAAAEPGCSSGNESAGETAPTLPHDTARVRLVTGRDTLRLNLELAKTPEQRELGLMERAELPDSAGMLFLYSFTQSDSAGYWMFRTRIPLDIAFLDAAGTIRSIVHMVPCTTVLAQGCPTYLPGTPYRAAVEVNEGYFAKHNVRAGDRFVLSDTAVRVSGR